MKRKHYHDSFLTVDGVDLDVQVEYSIVPAEPDVGEAGGIELLNVWYEDDGCIMDTATEEELNDLALRIGAEL